MWGVTDCSIVERSSISTMDCPIDSFTSSCLDSIATPTSLARLNCAKDVDKPAISIS